MSDVSSPHSDDDGIGTELVGMSDWWLVVMLGPIALGLCVLTGMVILG